MKFAKSIDYVELRKLLQYESVAKIECQIAARLKLNILQNETITYLQKELSAANIDEDTAIGILENDADDLLAFCLALIGDEEISSDAEVEEYPEGEEPDDDNIDSNNKVTLGIANGIALIRMCEFNFLRYQTYQELVNYLKWRRIPFHKKYAAQLRRVYRALFC